VPWPYSINRIRVVRDAGAVLEESASIAIILAQMNTTVPDVGSASPIVKLL
jgi:hypothetical protein